MMPICSPWIAAAVLLTVSLSSCKQLESEITLSGVRTFDEDTTRRFMDERHDEIDALHKSIKVAEIQEIFGAREAKRLQVAISAGEQSGDTVAAPDGEGGSEISLPAAPVGDVGRLRSAILRSLVTDADFRHSYKLLYKGDGDVLSTKFRVFLVRIDVSIPKYIDSSGRKFLFARFRVEHPSNKARVYALAPEYSALVARESWIATRISDYSGNFGYPVGSFDASASARQQKALEESFLSLVEIPLQFGLYGKKESEFVFAFGPHRRITRRPWISPWRWFGDKYEVDYEIRPGTRPCFALVVVPHENAIQQSPAKPGKQVPGPGQVRIVCDYARALRDGYDLEETKFELAGSAMITLPKRQTVSSAPAASPSGRPKIYPQVTSDLHLTVKHVVGPDTEVFIGPVRIPAADVQVLGRHRLAVRVKANGALQKILEVRGPGARVTLRIVSPTGEDPSSKVELHPATKVKPTPKISWTVTPATGAGPLPVTVKAKGFDLAKAKGVSIDGKMLAANTGWVYDTKKKELVVRLPAPPKGKKNHKIGIWLHDATGKVIARLRDVFSYAN